MTALYIILGILALIAVLLILPFGFFIEYSDGGLVAAVILGPLRFKLAPRPEKGKKPRKKPPGKEKKTAPPAERKGGKLSEFKRIWPYIVKALDKLRRRPKIDELIVHYMAAGDDPVAVALTYGGASAALGMITTVLEQNFIIKNRDFKTSFSFETNEPCIYLRFKLTMSVWRALYIGYPLISLLRKSETVKGKEE